MMELKETVEWMNSDDFKDRMKAEYAQLCIRIVKLQRAIVGTLPPGMSMNEFEWMGRQLDTMQKYRDFLGRRMAAKGIDLDGVVADVFH
jgi:hypothetical protein